MITPNRLKTNPDIEEEFVDKFYRYFTFSITTDCWEWNRKLQASGYGYFTYKNKAILAHRFSYWLFNGTIPHGLMVCHKCDNRKCVNPDHLFLGDSSTNVHDMIKKGRHSPPPVFYGQSHPRQFSKLTDSDVMEIYSYRDSNVVGLYDFLSSKFGVSKSTISQIMSGRRWKWLTQK